jgi:hypothetical protein
MSFLNDRHFVLLHEGVPVFKHGEDAWLRSLSPDFMSLY